MQAKKIFMIASAFAGSVLTIILVDGCSKMSADRLAAGMNICDTTHMGYVSDIEPIVQQFCYPCHGNGNTAFSDGVSLQGYDALKGWAQAGYLVGTVTHASGYNGMPYGKPMLDPCEINKIIAWVNQGEAQ